MAFREMHGLSKHARLLALVQGLYFVVTGIWPLVHMPSFIQVTGSKTDLWLVETVGILVIAIGLALITAKAGPMPPVPVIVQAIAAAAGLAAIDIIYVANGTIRPIYLADAFVELIFIGAWIVLIIRHRRTSSPPA
jgi:hypothetical protein